MKSKSIGDLRPLIDKALGTELAFARAYGLPLACARTTRDRLAAEITLHFSEAGCSGIALRKLLRKSVRVDRLRRFARAAVVSLLGSAPVAAAASAGGLVGCAAAGPIGGIVGAAVGTLCAVPAAAASATALYEIDARHRQLHPEFSLRVPSRHMRARNALAYAGGNAAANSPFIAGPALAAGLSTWGTTAAASLAWGVGALAALPLVSVAGAGVRVALQERMQARLAAPVLGVVQDTQGSVPRFSAKAFAARRDELKPSTWRLVWRDLRAFCKRVRAEFGLEFRRAWQARASLKQTLLNAAAMSCAQLFGLGAAAGAVAGGLSCGLAGPLQRTTNAAVGQAAWGASRPAPRAAPLPRHSVRAAAGAEAA